MAKHIFKLAFFLQALIFLASFSHATENKEGWKLRKEENGVAVYSKPQEGSDYDLIRATAHFPVDRERLLPLIMNPAKVPEWNSICTKAEWLKQESAFSGQVYYQYEMPWPLKDRDLIMARSVRSEGNITFIIGEVVNSDAKRNKHHIRVEQSSEYWELVELEDNTTQVSMTAFMDPAGPIPASLVNSLSTNKPIEALSKLREMTEEE